MKRADNAINERDEIRYQLKEKIVKIIIFFLNMGGVLDLDIFYLVCIG